MRQVRMGVDVVANNGDDETQLKLHTTSIAMFVAVARAAMIFGTFNPTLPMQRCPEKEIISQEGPN